MLIKTCAQSNLGRSRSVNEDSYLLDHDGSFFLVADGMGGHGNGEIASRITVESMATYLLDNTPSTWPWSGAADRLKGSVGRLREAVKAANRQVLAEVEKNPSLTGMGATLVALLVDGDSAVIAHVGDSRAYRLRNGDLRQLTEDHTWVHEQVSAGLLSADDARQHPFRSVVTRAVGGAEEVEVDVTSVGLEVGDLFLLCSDGLNAVLSDSDIAELLREKQSLETLADQLIATANDGGGPDNITVVLLEVEADS